MVRSAERTEIIGSVWVVVLTTEQTGEQTGALLGGGLMTVMLGHSELLVFDIPFDTFTFTLQRDATRITLQFC